MIPNYELRTRARKALSPVFPIALLVSLCAELPSLLAQVAGTISQQPLQNVLATYLASDPTRYSTEQLLTDLTNAISPTMGWTWIAALIAFLITPFLNLGRLNFTLKILRGEGGGIRDVLSRSAYFFKALGLTLLILLKEFLWALPGVAIMTAGYLILLLNPTVSTANIAMVLSTIGSVLMMVLMVRAALHYAMANLIVADKPETKIRDAIRQSIKMMQQKKMLVFSLLITFYAYLILCSLVQGLLEGISPVIGMTLGMAAQLAIGVYRQTSVAAFYEAYRPCHKQFVETADYLNDDPS